jgi:hypothetical protein
MKELQQSTNGSARQLTKLVGLGYRRFLRWQVRTGAGQPALVRPGPKKTAPLPLAALKAEIAALRHGTRRSRGTIGLYARYRHAISRRALARLVAEERAEQNKARRQVCKRITWHQPNLAWAVDTTERGRDSGGNKLYIHATRDLASRYGFGPLPAIESKGSEVAGYIQGLFEKHGAPLFFKRDNGSPLNDQEVDAVLAHWGVIPLNSPPRYPPYNGAIENGIRQLQAMLGGCLPRPRRWDPSAVAPYITAVQHELNNRPRRSLQGHSASEAYHHQPHAHYTLRERRAVFEWIRVHAVNGRERLTHFRPSKIDPPPGLTSGEWVWSWSWLRLLSVAEG